MLRRSRPVGPNSEVDPQAQTRRAPRRRSPRETGATGLALAAGFLARVVRIVVGVVVLILVAGIALFVLGANPTNGVVSWVHDTAHWLAGPFNGMFSFHSAKAALAVNWGIAALVYLILGGLIARLVDRLAIR